MVHLLRGHRSLPILISLVTTNIAAKAIASQQYCTQNEIKAAIEELPVANEEKLESLAECGEAVVSPLLPALESQEQKITYQAAKILYFVAAENQNTPDLLQAAEVARDILLKSSAPEIREQGARVLQAIAPGDPKTIDALLIIFSNKTESISVRQYAADALVSNSSGESKVVNTLLQTTIDNQDEDSVRSIAAFSISEIARRNPGAVDTAVAQPLIKVIEDSSQNTGIVTYCIRAVDQIDLADESVVKSITQSLQRQNQNINKQAAIALEDLATQFFRQANSLKALGNKEKQVRDIQVALNTLSAKEASEIKQAQDSVSELLTQDFPARRQLFLLQIAQRWLIGNRAVWILHPLIWIGLILAYPTSRRIQAFFFWNKHVRAVLGCWYVGPLISAVAPLRQRLFAPFKDSLLADAKLSFFEPQAYFTDSEVQLKGGKIVKPLTEVLPVIKEQVILEGESGLGKTMLLRHLVSHTKRVTVFLPAHKCENGVIEAIQAKLHGQAQDADFLRHLIYSGALDICIDGLNEVRAEVRANITAFVESYFKGNIVMTTQPLLWEPPATAKTYVLQPLQKQQIQQFLMVSQGYQLDDHSPEAKDYAKDCIAFLEQALDENQPSEELAAARRILSNPMDLSVVAQLIRNGLVPDLFQLRKQQYALMEQDYEQSWNQKFPLKQFSEFVYQMRLNDTYGMTGGDFYQALSIMEKEQHRMVLSRQWQDASGEPKKEWSFRHDKIMEFFLVQSFIGSSQDASQKRQKHLGDPRFRGIYLLLARLLPIELALSLREDLIHHAADTKDHTVSDDYVQIMRSRQAQ